MPLSRSPARKGAAAAAAVAATAAGASTNPSHLPAPSVTSSNSSSNSSNTNSRLGVVLSALALLGLVTITALMMLPILTHEAVKASEAAMAPFRADFLHGQLGQQQPPSSSSSPTGGGAGAGGGGLGGVLHFPAPEYSSGPSTNNGLASASSFPATTTTTTTTGPFLSVSTNQQQGLTPESLQSSPTLLQLDERSPPLFPADNTTCLHGGVLTALGCVCGGRTAGYRCETLLVSDEQLSAVQWCGPACWAGYVWYTTVHFKFAPIPPEQDRWHARVKAFLAWTQGGVLRAVPQQATNKALIERTDPILMDWLTSLGPFTNKDTHIIEQWRRFRAGKLAEVKSRYEERLNDTQQLAPKPDGARICFALIVHKDPDQFEAIWRVLYRPHHFYIIHIDTGADPELRKAVTATIDATPFSPSSINANITGKEGGWTPQQSIWEHVTVIDEQDSVHALWGDVTLVYLEAVMWMRAFADPNWRWDYFINLSAADIPIVPIEEIEKYIGGRIPGSFMSYHPNDQEFRQQHLTPEREKEGEVVVLSTLQAEMPSGRWRGRHGQSRIYGCTQWHMWHWTMAYEFATNPEVHGLLLSMKDTGIPDESFFATAALWLMNTAEQRKAPLLSIVNGDMKYRNEGAQRDLRREGEFQALTSHLWARKAFTAFVTCDYTNRLLNLQHDCSKYENATAIPEVQ